MRLKYQKGRTVNLGNFESFRVDIGIEIDGVTQESADETFEKLKTWVESKLKKETNGNG